MEGHSRTSNLSGVARQWLHLLLVPTRTRGTGHVAAPVIQSTGASRQDSAGCDDRGSDCRRLGVICTARTKRRVTVPSRIGRTLIKQSVPRGRHCGAISDPAYWRKSTWEVSSCRLSSRRTFRRCLRETDLYYLAPKPLDLVMTNAVVATVAIMVLGLLAVRLFWSASNHALAEDFRSPGGSSARLVARFQEICRTVLDPDILTFLAKNAPADVTSSFRMQQQRLTRFSLQVASGTLCQRLVGTYEQHPEFSFQRGIKGFLFHVQNGLLLVACGLGRAGLVLLQTLSYGTPRRGQLWVQAKVLSGVAGMMHRFAHDLASEPAWADYENDTFATKVVSDRKQRSDLVIEDVRAALSTALPNDLSRMICLATLRDNNTGGYYHPELARRFTIEASDRAMLVSHRELYERLVSLSLEDLTDQLDVYFATAHVSKVRSIEYWRRLRAYRATIPIGADPISAEILFMKVEVALAILGARVSTRAS
jgi:hypothetical protein